MNQSVLIQGILTYLAFRRFKEGVSAEFSPSQGFEDIGGGPADGYYPDLGQEAAYHNQSFGLLIINVEEACETVINSTVIRIINQR